MVQFNPQPEHAREPESRDGSGWVTLSIDSSTCGGTEVVTNVVTAINLLATKRLFRWDGDRQCCEEFSQNEYDGIKAVAFADAIVAMEALLTGNDLGGSGEDDQPRKRNIVACGRAMLVEMAEGMNDEVPTVLLPSMMWYACCDMLAEACGGTVDNKMKTAVVEEASRRFAVVRPQSALEATSLLCEVVLHIIFSLTLRERVTRGIESALKSVIVKIAGEASE